MGFRNHLPSCCYGELEKRSEELKENKKRSVEEELTLIEIEQKIKRMLGSLVNGECPVCGVNQLTGNRSRERTVGFVR